MKKILAICLSLLSTPLLGADALRLPDDPRQSIGYWKAHTIDPAADADAALAQRVFKRLLRAWDSSRVEPGLYVVNTEASAWAASLADGNILLSREAIGISLLDGAERGEHLLAFILAHELAHQRSDDLWHQRFFRSLSRQDEAQRTQLLDGLDFDTALLRDLEQKEAQADRDGLVMMASVGFDPWQVLEQQDFFTRWVESIWRQTCSQQGSAAFRSACRQAQTRALRTRVQLDAVAGQAVLYELGVQALVAKNYSLARHYFTLYGREYPGRTIMAAIGVSHLAEAMETRRRVQRLRNRMQFYYPLLLEAELGLDRDSGKTKRAAAEVEAEALERRLGRQVDDAVEFLERALRLDPEHRPLYHSLALAHLIGNNPYRLRGVMQGRYLPRFGGDAAVSLMLALSRVIENEPGLAIEELSALLQDPESIDNQAVMAPDLLRYTATANLARLYRQQQRTDQIEPLWRNLALGAQRAGRAYLFRLALQHLGSTGDAGGLKIAPTIKGVRLGDRKPRDDAPHRVNELWIEGELFHVYVYRDGARYVSAPNGKIVSAGQFGGTRRLGQLVRIGETADRPLKTLGIPDRRLQFTTGEYIAYDRYGLALRIDDNRVKGWFLYP